MIQFNSFNKNKNCSNHVIYTDFFKIGSNSDEREFANILKHEIPKHFKSKLLSSSNLTIIYI
jgi:hypothetical protein